MNNSGLYFTCTIGGLSEETFAVYQFTHEEALSSLYSLTLHVAAQVPIDLAGLIYQPASFNVWADGQIQRSVSGLVESIEQGKSGFRRTHFTIVIRPQAWLLTLRQDSRIFHFKTIPDILESLFQSHNVLYSSQLNDPHLVREYVTQKRETDYAFMQRLAAEEGITFWFEQLDEENEQIFFSDTRLGQKSGVSLVYNTHPQTAQTGNLASDVRWTVRARSGQAIHKDRNYLKPAYALMHTAKGTNANDAQFAVFESYGRFEDDSPGKNFTQYRVDALQAESEIGRLKANCFAIMPGAFFSLSEHPDDKMNTQWQAIRVSHKGYCPQALEEESDQGATVVTSEVEFISAQKEWRSPWIHKPVPDATEIAEVVGPKGEEIHTNEYGCVKVFFHWNRYDAMDDKASAWVRVSNQWASNGFGSVTLPRVGDEVLITYVDGDIDRPLISGRNYNAINKPPYALPDNKTKMVWRSKSYKSTGFNEISFEDNTGKEEIFIHGQKDMNILILNDTAWDVRHDYKNKIGNNYTQEITVNSDITIKGIEKHSTEGDRFHNVNGDSHLNTGKSLLIKNGDEMSVESGSKITLSAATELTIKAGSQFITLNPAGIFTSAPMNIGSGSAGKGKPASKNLPGLLELLAAPTLTQILVTRESAPYCEECEKCKNGMCGLDGPNSGNDSPGTGGPGGFGGGSGSGGGFGGIARHLTQTGQKPCRSLCRSMNTAPF
ncbi:type VI secretion system tip protein TssI/VgrG [Phytobacter massiliensis]|uniref:type VI secretion system tip protein TssI/VgrG n=1 Tax=Phytobacter massiliensis TaxID=1485952 RepID=UPI00031FB723|nr:type VI secretion system tip protein TssI/VgrG [Phytobacter massiliensis]